MSNIKQIMLKLTAKSRLYEHKVWLPSINELAKRNFSTRLEVADELMNEPQLSLEVVFRCYAFARAGAERAGYSRIAVKALRRAIDSSMFKVFASQRNAPEKMWQEFEAECIQERIGINKKLNEGVVKGLVILSQEARGYNIATYLKDEISTNLGDAFLRLSEIKGIGPKIACFLLRDFAWLFSIEQGIPLRHRKYLQPIDIWVERTAKCFWPDLKDEDYRVIAEKIVQECKEANISSIELNQGAWYFGAQEVKTPPSAFAKDSQKCKDYGLCSSLPLGILFCLAGALQARFLPLLDAGVAGQQPVLAQQRAQLFVFS
jgi:hypothetical protein